MDEEVDIDKLFSTTGKINGPILLK